MNFLVVGCGSIGQRHIRNLKNLGHHVYGCEPDLKKARQISDRYKINVFTRIEAAFRSEYNGVFICTPTSTHIQLALKAARKGLNLFIEKPLSNNLKGIDELRKIANRKKITVLVGCNIRFLPSIRRIKKTIKDKRIGKVLSVRGSCGFYLPYWHPKEDYRKGYSANKKLGGGVILDDIHELDLLYWLFGDIREVFCYKDRTSKLGIDTEDCAEIFLKFKSGVIAQIHLDYLQRTYRKNYEFIGEKGIITWDYIKQIIEVFGKKPNQKSIFQESINTNHEVMFIEELKHFFRCIEGREKSINNIDAAKRTLQIALCCHRSAKERKTVRL